MTKDKDIEELFLAQTPHFDDSAEFMAKLTKRLEAVEIVKQYQERTLHRYKVMMVVAFVVGIVSGTVSTIWLLSSPIELPSVNFQTQKTFLVWFIQNSRFLAAAVFPMLMTFAACLITSNVLEIVEMRRKMDKFQTSRG
ncbi:MAG: hypothetical protein J6W03_10245 [Bacteroidaceae bacterium]|nr:hypothetical protein [Bacteroidaceae bacterium]